MRDLMPSDSGKIKNHKLRFTNKDDVGVWKKKKDDVGFYDFRMRDLMPNDNRKIRNHKQHG